MTDMLINKVMHLQPPKQDQSMATHAINKEGLSMTGDGLQNSIVHICRRLTSHDTLSKTCTETWRKGRRWEPKNVNGVHNLLN